MDYASQSIGPLSVHQKRLNALLKITATGCGLGWARFGRALCGVCTEAFAEEGLVAYSYRQLPRLFFDPSFNIAYAGRHLMQASTCGEPLCAEPSTVPCP